MSSSPFIVRSNCTNVVLLDVIPLYRYYYGRAGAYFYTTSAAEIGTIKPGTVGRYGWVSEGVACYILRTPQPNTIPFYRYGRALYSHFYTTSWRETGTNVLGQVSNGWTMEGTLGYVYRTKQPGTCPLYRYYRPDQHFYTVNPCEIGVVRPGVTGVNSFKLEGIAAYVYTTFQCGTPAC